MALLLCREDVYRVHLLGVMRATAAAWPHMKKHGYGRIIMVSSLSGVYGNVGQASYGAMKMAVIGFGKSLALEGNDPSSNRSPFPNRHCSPPPGPVCGFRRKTQH